MLVYLVTFICMTGDPTCGTPPTPYDCVISADRSVIGCGVADPEDALEALATPNAIEIDAAIIYEESLLTLAEDRTVIMGGWRCALVETMLTCDKWKLPPERS